VLGSILFGQPFVFVSEVLLLNCTTTEEILYVLDVKWLGPDEASYTAYGLKTAPSLYGL